MDEIEEKWMVFRSKEREKKSNKIQIPTQTNYGGSVSFAAPHVGTE